MNDGNTNRRRPGLSALLAAMLMSALLAACGGGGSDTAVSADSGDNSQSTGDGSGNDTGTDSSGGTDDSGSGDSAGADPGTGTGTDGSGTSGAGAGNMSITVLDGPVTRNPVAGVSVSLYETDDKTIAQTVVTGADGVANFGAIASGNPALKSTSGHRTLTIAEPLTGGGFDVITIVNLKAGAYPWYVGDDGPGACNRVGTLATGTFTGLTGAETGVVWPLFAGQSPLAGPTGLAGGQVSNGILTISDVPVCEHHLQADGTLSLLVAGAGADGQITTYGFFAGLTVSNAMTVQGDASTAPGSLPWTGSPPHLPTLITTANLNGPVFFPLTSAETGGASSGTVPVLDQIPGGAFWVTGNSEDYLGAQSCTSIDTYATLPTTATIRMPDFGAVLRSFDATQGTLDLTLPGPDTADLQIISFDVSAPNSSWTLLTDGTSTRTVLPDLPPSVDLGAISAAGSDVSLVNLNDLDGFDAVIELFLQQTTARPSGAVPGAGFADSEICSFRFLANAGPGGSGSDGNDSPGGDGSNGGSGATGGDPGGSGGAATGSLSVSGGPLNGTFAPDTGTAQDLGGTLLSISWTDAAGNAVAVFPDSSNPAAASLVSITPDGGSPQIVSAATGPLPVSIDSAARTVTFSGVDVQGSVLTGTLGF
jgi:hypothetical protein